MFYVWMYNHREGKEKAMKEWIKSELEPFLRGFPGVKSVKTFMRRVGLGPRPIYQTFIEIPNFAFLDKWVEASKERWKIMDGLFALSKDFETKIVYQL